MIQGYGPVTQALLGTLLTWGLTAGGSAMVIFLRGNQRKSLDIALGFAAGVMIAASFWSLLAPAIELAEQSGTYGAKGEYAFIPVAGGFLLGSIFVFGTDKIISYLGINSPHMMIALTHSNKDKVDIAMDDTESNLEYQKRVQYSGVSNGNGDSTTIGMDSFADCLNVQHGVSTSRRRRKNSDSKEQATYSASQQALNHQNALAQWKRIILLVIAITVHNIPEGLAVGVSFGAIGNSESATFESARNLAIGIGIQNFPEGLAVSLPLHAAGFSMLKSFWYGQLSGMVEPVFGVLGAVAVTVASIILSYALSFAAGAMIYIVADDILPEAHLFSCASRAFAYKRSKLRVGRNNSSTIEHPPAYKPEDDSGSSYYPQPPIFTIANSHSFPPNTRMSAGNKDFIELPPTYEEAIVICRNENVAARRE